MESHVVDVWLISCDGTDDPSTNAILSEGERKRAAAFLFPEHRLRYIQAHVSLRRILHRYTGVLPEALQFGEGEKGKPFLDSPSEPLALSFNLSHSADLAIVAVAAVTELGADVEQVRPIPDWDEVARGSFHPAEIEWVRSARPNHQADAFFQVWTMKEAYIKADGRGLAHPLDSFAVVGRTSQTEYVITQLELPLGYRGAVAHPPPRREIRQFWWRERARSGVDLNP